MCKITPPISHVLYRSLTATPPQIVGGEGPYLIDDTGKRYLDACDGAAISTLGHDNAAVRKAICDQVDTRALAHTGLFTNPWTEELSDYLVAHAPQGTGEGRLHRRRQFAAMEAGMSSYPALGCADATAGDHVLVAPCFTSTEAEIDTIVSKIADALDTAR